MSVKEKQEQLVGAMKRWQKIENAAVAQTGKIMEQTDNTLIRLVAEIIQRDSNLHHRVQQTIIESIDREHINLSVDDLEKVWTSIDQHIQIEKKTIELAKQSLSALEGTKHPIQQYLLSYLLQDEQKHDKLLSDLELIKKGMYP
jgi:hypothetical protein